MATRYFLIVLTALSATLFTGFLPLNAAEPETEPETEPEVWHQVEVIIFQQRDNFKDEVPRRDSLLRYPDNYVELIDPTLPDPADTTGELPGETDPLPVESVLAETEQLVDSAPEPEQPFLMLDKSQRQLNADARAIERSNNYRVLYHQAWRQPAMDSRDAPWILIRAGDRYGEYFELEGSLRLVSSRYQHIETNLWLTGFANNFGQEQEVWPALPEYPVTLLATVPASDKPVSLPLTSQPVDLTVSSDFSGLFDSSPFGDTTARSPYIVTSINTLNTSRKLRRDELHYLDHPIMGVLVRVTRYELPELEPELKEVISLPPQNLEPVKPTPIK